jgi:hypothetical protein
MIYGLGDSIFVNTCSMCKEVDYIRLLTQKPAVNGDFAFHVYRYEPSLRGMISIYVCSKEECLTMAILAYGDK